jgi:hypothetical protein
MATAILAAQQESFLLSILNEYFFKQHSCVKYWKSVREQAGRTPSPLNLGAWRGAGQMWAPGEASWGPRWAGRRKDDNSHGDVLRLTSLLLFLLVLLDKCMTK